MHRTKFEIQGDQQTLSRVIELVEKWFYWQARSLHQTFYFCSSKEGFQITRNPGSDNTVIYIMQKNQTKDQSIREILKVLVGGNDDSSD